MQGTASLPRFTRWESLDAEFMGGSSCIALFEKLDNILRAFVWKYLTLMETWSMDKDKIEGVAPMLTDCSLPVVIPTP